MASTFPTEPDDLSAAGLTHGDVTDALAAVEAYVGPAAEQTITGTRDHVSTTPFVGAHLDMVIYGGDLGEPVPSATVRYTVLEAAQGGLFTVGLGLIGETGTDINPDQVISNTLLVVERHPAVFDANLDIASFNIVLPTTDGDNIYTGTSTAADVVAAFNSSTAAGRVLASLLPGEDGSGVVQPRGSAFLFGETVSPHVQLRDGIVTSPVTIHPDQRNTSPLSMRPSLDSILGTAVLNIEHYDGSPNDNSGYGVSHLDSDGGGGFASGRITFSQQGQFKINAVAGGSDAFNVSADGSQIFIAGGVLESLTVINRTPDQAGLGLNAQPGQTADMLRVFNGDTGEATFRVNDAGQVHADGGLVLTSPSGTAYRLIVADDGTLSTTPA